MSTASARIASPALLPRVGPTLAALSGVGLLVLALHASGLFALGQAMSGKGIKVEKPVLYGKLLTQSAPRVVAAAAKPKGAVLKSARSVSTLAPTLRTDSIPEDAAKQAPPAPAQAPEPQAAASAPAPAASAVAAKVDDAMRAVLNAETGTGGKANPDVPAPTASVFPRSTKVSYRGTGVYRGPMEGDGSFEWVYDQAKSTYKLFLRAKFGLSGEFRSEGRVGDGLILPTRYEEVAGGRAPRATNFDHEKKKVSFSATTEVLDMPAGIQDAATIMMQISGVLASGSGEFTIGQKFGYHVGRVTGLRFWTFEVMAVEELTTPLGRMQTYLIKRTNLSPEQRDLSLEFWLAPSLEGLPVRVVLKPSADITMQLDIEKAEQQ